MGCGQLFIAPHLDDTAISCGGTLLAHKHDPVACRHMAAVTVFSRSNYTRDGLGAEEAVTRIRQREERTVLGRLGIVPVFLDVPECPLRGYTISDPLDYPKEVNAELDRDTGARIADLLVPLLASCETLLVPVATGPAAHVDHRLCRHAGLRAWTHSPRPNVVFYEDVPYVGAAERRRLNALRSLERHETKIDLEAKLELIRGYTSQPIDEWETNIRARAGRPPVERTWQVVTPQILARFSAW